MSWGRTWKKANNFLEKANEFLNDEIPEYALTIDTIYYCDTCNVIIPKDIHEKNLGSCSKCVIHNYPPRQEQDAVTNRNSDDAPKR